MTCIVMINENDKTYIAYDQTVQYDYNVIHMKNSKLIHTDGMVIGISGNFNKLQELATTDIVSQKEYIDSHNDHDEYNYLLNVFMPIYKDVASGNHAIITINNKLFTITIDNCLIHIKDNYYAVGSGMRYALGSLFSSKPYIPTSRIKLAMESASYFNTHVSNNYQMLIFHSSNNHLSYTNDEINN